MDGLSGLKCSRPTWVVSRVPKHNEPCSGHQEALCVVWIGLCADWYHIIIHIHSSERRLYIWGHVRIYGIGIYQNSSQRLRNEIALKPPKLINHNTGMGPTNGSTSHRALPEYFWRENNHSFSSLTRSWDLCPPRTAGGRGHRLATHSCFSPLQGHGRCLSSWHILLPLETGNQSRVSDYLQHCITRSTLVNVFHRWRRWSLPGTRGGCLCLAGEGPGSAASHSGMALGWSKQKRLWAGRTDVCSPLNSSGVSEGWRQLHKGTLKRGLMIRAADPQAAASRLPTGPAWVPVSATNRASRGQPGRGEEAYCSQSSCLLNMLRQMFGVTHSNGGLPVLQPPSPSICVFPVLWVFSLNEFISWFMKERVVVGGTTKPPQLILANQGKSRFCVLKLVMVFADRNKIFLQTLKSYLILKIVIL